MFYWLFWCLLVIIHGILHIAPYQFQCISEMLIWVLLKNILVSPKNDDSSTNKLAKLKRCASRALLLALVLVELQNTCKKKLNRKMLERPNICYIFEKLSVQGCQIWHSHVSIPFNSAPAHSTRPHNAKKALYVIISGKIPENLVHKSYWHKH